MSNVVIHYSGNASDDQKVALFDTLTNTILGQVSNGEFDPIASVHYVEASMTESSDVVETSSNPKSSSPAGAIGGIIGAIVLVALIIAGVVVYRKRQNGDGCGGSAAVVPASNNSSGHVPSSDGTSAVRAHVFG